MKNLSYRIAKGQKTLGFHAPEELFIEEVALQEITKSVGSPFYCYSKQSLCDNYQSFVSAFENFKISDYKICYAIKANYNLNLVKILAQLGSGIDAVSAGEIYRALKAGINPKKIVFAGVGKSREEIAFALQNNVEEFSVESIPEMFLLNEVAASLGKVAKFSLRVNPHVDAKTHDKISTGRKGDKFGVDIEQAEEIYAIAAKLLNIDIYGISMHIGSQITSLEPFAKSFSKLRDLCLRLRELGHSISALDFGGGIGISYKDEQAIPINDYVELIKEMTLRLDVKITIAPGRALIGNAGILVVKTLFIKETEIKNFVVIDGAINDLMRPGLYGSYHELLPVLKRQGEKSVFDFAGPVCESTDILAQNREIIIPKNGDLFAFCGAGAYGSSMSSEYNCRPLVPEVLVDGKNFSIIRRRPTFEEMIRFEE